MCLYVHLLYYWLGFWCMFSQITPAWSKLILNINMSTINTNSIKLYHLHIWTSMYLFTNNFILIFKDAFIVCLHVLYRQKAIESLFQPLTVPNWKLQNMIDVSLGTTTSFTRTRIQSQAKKPRLNAFMQHTVSISKFHFTMF